MVIANDARNFRAEKQILGLIFGAVFGDIFKENEVKIGTVFDSLLGGLWGALGRRCGPLGPLLGGMVF